ncbi:hypothetical protein CDD81_5623 [Ophiocordyceps australis]|uniref:Uncharacterized protein n=1 Tax=Ophiocordyceps australis TaxID=1399860 RepID=A0A2C5Y8R4_9HYPO|nr:hypothetical protein CDD81_5623 [Ophiocordyceps australis]
MMPDIIKAGSEQFKRQNIAEAMNKGAGRAKYETIKGPDFEGFDRKKLWVAKVNNINEKPSQNIRVVYSGDKFVGLVDVSDPEFCFCSKQKPLSNPPSVQQQLKRAKRANLCSCGEMEERIDENGKKGPRRNQSRKRPSKGENTSTHEAKSPHSEEAKSSHGEDAKSPSSQEAMGAKDKGSKELEEENTISAQMDRTQKIKTARLANEISDQEFTKLATRRGLDKVVQEKWQKSLSQVRQLVGYKALDAESPRLSISSLKLGAMGSGGLAIGATMWAASLVDAFTHDTSGWERSEAITAIIPFVGCTTTAAADVAHGSLDSNMVLDTSLCFLGDALLLTPAWPAGVVVHVVRAILSQFTPPDVPSLEAMKKTRDEAWSKYLDDRVYTFIYSHPRLYREGGFGAQIEATLAIEELAVLSQSAQTIGAVGALGQSVQETHSNENRWRIIANVQAAISKTLRATSREIARRQRATLMDIARKLHADTNLSLKTTADRFNEAFSGNMTSWEMVARYTQTYTGDPEIPGMSLNNQDDVRNELGEIAACLRKTPLKIPSLFELAFVVGQSKGLVALHEETLSIQGYIRAKMSETRGRRASNYQINLIALRHTLAVAQLLRGTRQQDALPIDLDNLDAEHVEELHLLITLKYGWIYDDCKSKLTDKLFGGAKHWSREQYGRVFKFFTHPVKLPIFFEAETVPYIALVLGLEEKLVENLMEEMKQWLMRKNTAHAIFEALSRKAAEAGKKVKELNLEHFHK